MATLCLSGFCLGSSFHIGAEVDESAAVNTFGSRDEVQS